ncbi:isochorismatase [Bacterioplanes sanyensis]|uniref:Isochorismatase n=1 Tax=Bacterioplanes sanyensis TaxID=1249553 RepID=A0A222FIB8_9GAMM|nr:isochorismatase family protein [Bacterioplanes sanyensis]ASP38336.1 isochorismatase [Bacterioplanes sanyensis]
MTPTIEQQVLQASQAWVEQFNRGQLDACLAGYRDDAVMTVTPHGRFHGKHEIAAFWREFAQLGPAELVYRDVRIQVIDEYQAVLSATWSMNIASGFITKELWVRAAIDAPWQLLEDDFTVKQQWPTPRSDNSKTALVVVDMQNDYFEGGAMTLSDTQAAADKTAQLLHAFRRDGRPIIHVQHVFADDEKGFFVAGTLGSEIHSQLAPLATEPVVIKSAVNSFKGTNLERLLIDQGIEELVVTGAMAHVCVDAITRAAVDKGYRCQLIIDACAAPDISATTNAHSVKESTAHVLGFAYANVTTTAALLAQLA